MILDQAIQNGFTIIVPDMRKAHLVKKKYPRAKVKSVNSRNLDGLREVFIDESICLTREQETMFGVAAVYGLHYGKVEL